MIALVTSLKARAPVVKFSFNRELAELAVFGTYFSQARAGHWSSQVEMPGIWKVPRSAPPPKPFETVLVVRSRVTRRRRDFMRLRGT